MKAISWAVRRTFDIDKLRAEALRCQYVVHFNYAGSSLVPPPGIDAAVNHIWAPGDLILTSVSDYGSRLFACFCNGTNWEFTSSARTSIKIQCPCLPP